MARIAAAPAMPMSALHDEFLAALSGGDAASLRRSNFRRVSPGRGSGRYEEAYLYPDTYNILVRLADPGLAARSCRWRSGENRVEGPCGVELPLAVGPGARRGDDWVVEAQVHVSVDGSPEQAHPVAFRDELVVALGDSYISGEGNPDVPSLIHDRPAPVFEAANWGDRLDSSQFHRAEWWDESCHRSLLSWPVLATLAHAAQRPRQAVTLVHLGCSGAVVADIITRGEQDLPGGGDEPRRDTQMALLARLLAAGPAAPEARRTPSRTLLSVGGNDAGFVGVIAALTLPPSGYTVRGGQVLVGLFGAAICPYRDSGPNLRWHCRLRRSAQTRLEELPARYAALARHLARPGWGAVHQVTYPNPALGENNVPCQVNGIRDPENMAEMSGFEALMGILPQGVQGNPYSWQFQLNYLPEADLTDDLSLPPGVPCDWDAEPHDSEVCQALWVHATLNRLVADNARDAADGVSPRWTVVDSHVARISGHGVCRRAVGYLPALPRVRAGEWSDGWTPRSYRPYDCDNPRWFRTPNDSIVTQYGDNDHFHHGTFHPTFRAHLEVAEAVLREAFAR